MKIYQFKYCPNTDESGYITLSTHRTEKGAQLAMEFHRNEQLKEFNELYKPYGFTFGEGESWVVTETELKE